MKSDHPLELSFKLLSGDDRAKAQVAEELFELGSDASPAIPNLIRALDDTNDMVRYYVCATLAQIGPPASSAVLALSRLFVDEDVDEPTRGVAASALGQIGSASERVLIDCLVNPNSFTRRKAAGALGLFLTRGLAIQPLIAVLGDPDPDVRSAASESLESISKAATTEGAISIRMETLSLLQDATKSTNSLEALNASRILLKADPTDALAIACLLRNIKSSDSNIKSYSIWFASNAGPNALPLLSELIVSLRDSDAEIRYLAADAIGAIGNSAHPAISALIPLLDDDDARVRGHGAHALGMIGPAAKSTVDKLKKLLNDEDEEVVLFANQAINRLTHSS